MHAREVKKLSRWYFGGVTSAGAAVMTQPLDLLKVHLQTHTLRGEKKSMFQLVKDVLRQYGCIGLYAGVTASVLRHLTYSTTRFALYGFLKKTYNSTNTFVGLANSAIAGAVGGFVGVPCDVVCVRMQHDLIMPPEERRNYSNGLHGLYKILRYEGILTLFSGATSATCRSVLMSIGQLCFFDQIKWLMLTVAPMLFKDNTMTHIIASILAAIIATILTQPMDVVKTRMMSAEPGQYKGVWDCVKSTSKEGLLAFYKGFCPSFYRVGPNIVVIHVVHEQLRINFGIDPPSEGSYPSSTSYPNGTDTTYPNSTDTSYPSSTDTS